MGRSTLGRDYDIGRMLSDYGRRISVLERLILQLRVIFTPGVVYDTGWVAVPAAAGFTSSLEVRRIGHSVTYRGSLLPTVDWGAASSLQQPVAAGGIPAQFRTPVSLNYVGATASAVVTTTFRVQIRSDGGIQVRCSAAAHTSSCSVNAVVLDS
jgi:hypothetical protein